MWIPLLLGGAAIYAVSQSQKPVQPTSSDTYDAQIDELQGSISQLESSIITLENQLDAALAQTEVDATTIASLNAKIADLEAQLEAAIAAGVAVSQADVDYVQDLLDEANETVIYWQNQHDILSNEYDVLETDKDDWMNQAQDWQNQHDILSDAYDLLEDEKDDFEAQAQDWQNQHNTLNDAYNALQDERDDFEAEAQDWQNQHNTLSDAYNALQDERDDFEAEAQDWQNQHNTLNDAYNALQDERDDFEAEAQDWQNQHNTLSDAYDILEDERDAAIAADQLTPYNQADLDASNSIIAAQRDAFEAEAQDWENQYNTVSAQASQYLEERNAFEAEAQDWENQYDAASQQASQYLEERDAAIAADELTPYDDAYVNAEVSSAESALQAQYTDQINDLTAQRDSFEAEADSWENQYVEADQLADTWMENAFDYANDAAALQVELEDANFLVDLANENANYYAGLYNTASQNLLAANDALNAAEMERALAEADAESYANEAATWESQYNITNAAYENALETVNYWQDLADEYEAELAVAVAQREEAIEEVNNLNQFLISSGNAQAYGQWVADDRE